MNPTIQGLKSRYGLIGNSEGINDALRKSIRVAGTDLTVLITGESGVGKEVISKIIHQQSPRKHNPFIAINCGAIPEGTINSELFGHEKGAFTGATADRKGYFETVDGGTIFLDEIGELPLDTQSYLLRVLESGEFIRVGSSAVLHTDVRVIAATNVDLYERVENGKFRRDLYYRLNTVPIVIPPLRERRDDIWMIFRKFSLDIAERHRIDPITLTPEAKTLLLRYQWPGNIRELKNVAEQLSIMSERRTIDENDLLEVLPELNNRYLPARTTDDQNLDGNMQEREILYKLLFDMKNDLNELKSLVFGLIKENKLDIPDAQKILSLPERASTGHWSDRSLSRQEKEDLIDASYNTGKEDLPSIIIEDRKKERSYFEDSEPVEENLSLEDMEKEMIKKALKKYNGKRKDASEELGISERTLYRKIKQYELE
ncbi:sigma-54 dependent transcriptional regulator [Membranicola marinus]|uniref:Sigma-54 dependent transcriptional regulator n=1 Tax=Membranihabitans marinus TaxID=1227546 RepID=A0A953HRN7_9BACT|nr:sigma-54 dependent transcriptional regulator [Membranihabitans marinus]MBY5959678.1 sigma-54 dependent transcriptional regulator [Membranihabitans marinus]